MTVTIREAAPRDRERLIDLLQTLNRDEDLVTGDRRCDRGAAEENLETTEARLARTGGRFLVAEVGGEVAGLLTLAFQEEELYVRAECRPYAHIVELVVAAERRRQGVGRALMAAAERLARERGHTRLTVGVMAGNAAAELAYARQGFRPLAHHLVKPLGNPVA